MTEQQPLSQDDTAAALKLDAAAEIERIGQTIKQQLKAFKRKGLVVALSGGIDSSAVGALAVAALGKERVFGLFMPEQDSSKETHQLGRLIIEHLGIESVDEDITPILDSVGCYRRRDDAIREVLPNYQSDWKSKIVLPALTGGYRFYSVVAESPDGQTHKARLTTSAYLGILAATNFKQRVRKMLEYYHADRLNYAVAGTPNRLEYDQGFFVKLGDGAADLKPIAHLYKTQVYQLAEELWVPKEISQRPPTTDTYSLAQSQEEFYFSVPYQQMDLCLYGKNHGWTPEQLAPALSLSPEQVGRVYDDIDAKRKVSVYLHATPTLIK